MGDSPEAIQIEDLLEAAQKMSEEFQKFAQMQR